MKRKQLAPHIHADQPAAERYIYVCLALLPAWIAGVFYYGFRVLVLSAVSILTFFFSDYLSTRKLYPEQAFYVDYSSIVSGLLLTLLVPVSTSVWAIFLAALFGSLLIKQAFGGVGTNIFNPALASRMFLEFAFPSQMTVVEGPFDGLWHVTSLLTGKPAVDTPSLPDLSWSHILSGRIPSMIGTATTALILLGMVILIERRLFHFEASLAYFATLIIGYIPCYIHSLGLRHFVSWITCGGLVLIGVFMLNDCTTMPLSRRGRAFFGCGTGILTLLMYRFGNSTYAMIFPVLMMNMTTPIFDRYIRPQAFSKSSWYREVKS